jgi:hypothetical protein
VRHPDRDHVAIDELTEMKYRRRTAPRPHRAALSSMVMPLAGENLAHEAENRILGVSAHAIWAKSSTRRRFGAIDISAD